MTKANVDAFLELMMLKDNEVILDKHVENLTSLSAIVFKGKSFIFGAGALETLKRAEAELEVTNRGGFIKNAVTKTLDYMVVPNQPDVTASKYKAAIQQGKTIITEKEFLEALK